ncbi:hypothetical protein AB0N09_21810 [Streptomyces erythrochromogenes]|uniref:hypothetical protein n=1 Tax=Streptomyces erythrochromogenes TaxID=285574 RepID=UPI0034349B5C
MDDITDIPAPCNCGTLGDHERTKACTYSAIVQIEVTGDRQGILQAIGVLRTSYYVYVEHEWQNPETGSWVFQLGAVENLWKTRRRGRTGD